MYLDVGPRAGPSATWSSELRLRNTLPNHVSRRTSFKYIPPRGAPRHLRALTISEHGGLDRLEYRTDVAVPTPGPDEVRVRVLAAALNHLDLFVLAGLPGVTITPPWIMGGDAVGVIDGTDDLVVINPGLSDGISANTAAVANSRCASVLRFLANTALAPSPSM